MREVAGKTAFITGGASGIGLAMARSFSAAGMKVVIADIEQAALDAARNEFEASNAEFLTLQVDVTDRDDMAAAAAATESRFGNVHVVCNNAGVVVGKPSAQMSDGDWAWVLGVDLQGVVNGVQAFLPGLVEQGEGHIVNTSSIAGLIPLAAPAIISYTAAKYGVVGITETLHGELRDQGIGASVLCPGVVNTRIGESARNRPDADATPPPPPPPTELPPGVEPPRVIGGELIEPEVVAQRVVEAVKNNDLYIVTHPETREAVEARFAGIMAAYDKLEASLTDG